MPVIQSVLGLLGASATPNVSFQATPKTGRLVVLSVVGYQSASVNPTVTSVTDNQGAGVNTYAALATSQVTTGASDNYRHVLYGCVLAAASGTFTVTATMSASSSCALTLTEISDAPSSNYVDQITGTTGSSTAPSVTLATTTTAACLVLGAMTHNNGSPTITPNATNIPRELQENEDNASFEASSVAVRTVAATGAYTASWALGATSTWSVFAVAIKQDTPEGIAVLNVGGAAAWTATNGATFAPALPVDWQADDIHLLVAQRGDATALTGPAGWTNLAGLSGANSTLQVDVYWRRAVAGDTAPTLTMGTSTVVRGGRIYGVRGCPTSGSPFDTGTGAATRLNNASSTTVSFTDVTTTVAGCAVLAIGAINDNPTAATLMSGYLQPTGLYAGLQATALGNDAAQVLEWRTLAAAGAAGASTFTQSGAAAALSVGLLLALQPEAVAATDDYPATRPWLFRARLRELLAR